MQNWLGAWDRVLYDAVITRHSATYDDRTVIVGIDDACRSRGHGQGP